MKKIKEIAQEVKDVLEVHDKAFKMGHEHIWKACNTQLDILHAEACAALADKHFWKLFPKGNASILEYLDAPKE